MQSGDGGTDAGAGASAGGAPRGRRLPLAPYAVGPQPTYQQQQQQQGLLQYPSAMGLPTGGAAPSLRYVQQQQQQQQQQMPMSMSMPMRTSFWQTNVGLDPGDFGKSQQQGAGGVEMELSDILVNTGGVNAGQTPAGAATSASDMALPSFGANPFQGGISSAKGGYHSGSASSTISSGLGPVSSGNFLAANSRKPNAAVNGPGSEFAVFVHGPDEPDLTTRKLEDKTLTCDFHECPNRARVAQAYGKFCNRHVIVAPCGFPACRDKAVPHDTMCKNHLTEGKDALHEILKNRPNSVPVCRIFGCFKNDQGGGYCRGHEKLLMAMGRLPAHISKRRLNSAYTMCSYPDCGKHSQRNHLCRTHGNAIMAQAKEMADRPGATEGYEEILSRLQKDIRRCTHENCTKNSQRDRLCTMHYLEKNKMQRDGSVASSPASSGTATTSTSASLALTSTSLPVPAPAAASSFMCTQPGCTSRQVSNDLCRYHASKLAEMEKTGSKRTRSDTHTMERTRCSTPGCLNQTYTSGVCRRHLSLQKASQAMNQPRLGDLGVFSTAVGVPSVSPSDVENEAKQGLFILNGKSQTNAGAGVNNATPASGGIANSATTGGSTTCSNPICVRESYGRDYCDACQNLFSPFVASAGDLPAGATGYQLAGEETAGSAAVTTAGGDGSPCRVGNCSAPSVRASLCEVHFRAFESGSLSVDQLKLESQERQREQNELADAAAAAAAAVAEAKQPSPTTAKGGKKYFCQVEGCDKQAQKRGLCKRHFRVQEGTTVSRVQKDEHLQQLQQFQQFHPQSTGTDFPLSIVQAGGSGEASHPCQFPGCTQEASRGTRLCLMHAKATFCWQPGCKNLVAQPLFCEFHAFRQRCAFENCMYGAERGMSGCANHVLAKKCRHEFCDKFAVGLVNDWCRLHQISCHQAPCALCKLHSPSLEGQDENSNRSRSNVATDKGTSSGMREPRMI